MSLQPGSRSAGRTVVVASSSKASNTLLTREPRGDHALDAPIPLRPHGHPRHGEGATPQRARQRTPAHSIELTNMLNMFFHMFF